MNTLLKLNSNTSSLFEGLKIIQTASSFYSVLCSNNNYNNKPTILNTNSSSSLVNLNSLRTHYTFNSLSLVKIRYRRATRPKKTSTNSILLNYEQAQFAEKIGVTKSWNSWNTSNLLGGKRQAESVSDDLLIRKFLYGTFHGLLASEIIIKRRLNTINIGFLSTTPKQGRNKIYFLVGYSEELLSSLLKCVVKIQVQTVYNKLDLVFRTW